MHTKKFTIVVSGKTPENTEEALQEAARLMLSGNLSGAGRNEESGFYFDSTDDVQERERPIGG